MNDALQQIAELTAKRADARYRAEEIDLLWRQVIQSAIRLGRPVPEIAEVAGISRARVYQIRDGKR